MKKIPAAYFLTFRTYGTWLPGDVRESVDKKYNQICTKKKTPNQILLNTSRQSMLHNACILNQNERETVLNSLVHTCKKYEWRLFAAHVRSNHTHIIVQSIRKPEYVMTQLKAYATRHLRKSFSNTQYHKVWARHGSTQYIWHKKNLYPTLHYVIDEQGNRQSCFYEKWYDEMQSNDLLI